MPRAGDHQCVVNEDAGAGCVEKKNSERAAEEICGEVWLPPAFVPRPIHGGHPSELALRHAECAREFGLQPRIALQRHTRAADKAQGYERQLRGQLANLA
jgi:hypothetical protein